MIFIKKNKKMPTRFMNNDGVESGGIFMDENGLVKKSSIYNVPKFSDESSSSIGKNSDLSENSLEKSCDGDEVQSSYNKGALDAMEALEEVLPIRRGISSFYNGKSKSYTSLPYASSSTKDIGKPENPYTRKRRNQLSCTLNWDKNRASRLKTNGGLCKKPRTTLALGLAMSASDDSKKDGECIDSDRPSLPSLSSLRSTDFSPWRSFSLADLQRCVTAANTCSGLNSNS